MKCPAFETAGYCDGRINAPDLYSKTQNTTSVSGHECLRNSFVDVTFTHFRSD